MQNQKRMNKQIIKINKYELKITKISKQLKNKKQSTEQ